MDALQESGWEELRKEARKIEGDLDVKLSSYAKLGARFTQGGEYFSLFDPLACGFAGILSLFVHYFFSFLSASSGLAIVMRRCCMGRSIYGLVIA